MRKKTVKLPKGIRVHNGSYEGRSKINGVSISVHDPDLDKCIKKLEDAKAQARNNVNSNSEDVILNDYYDEWMNTVKSKKVKEQSVAPMKRCYDRTFKQYLGNMKIINIYPMDIQRAINALHEIGIPVGTIRDSLGRLRECLEFAVSSRIIPSNPCIPIEVPWTDKRTKEEIPLSVKEQNELLEELDIENNWYKEAIYIMILTGVRVGELGALQWSDVDFKKKCIHIKHSLSCSYLNGVKTELISTPKTVNSIRDIPFLDVAEEMLLSQKKKVIALKKQLKNRWRAKEEFGDIVFTTTMGSPCTRYIMQKELNKIVKRINERHALEMIKNGVMIDDFRHIHPHLLRHTFATRCFEFDMDPKVVQKLMGHSTISTTLNIYTHVLEEKQMQEVEKFGKVKTKNEVPDHYKNLPNITALSHI